MLQELLNGLEETLFMVFSAGLLTWLIGLPLGTLLAVTGPDKILENAYLRNTLSVLIHTTRNIPYVAFMVALIPLTKWVIGTSEGSIAAIVPLTLAAIPFFAEACESAINKLQPGLIEAARSVGATSFQILYKVLIPEALPSIISGLTSTLTRLVGYSTIAGALGGGGLGGLIVLRGYQNFQPEFVWGTLLILLALVLSIQTCGDYIANGNAQNTIAD